MEIIGILAKTTEARENTIVAGEKEQLQLAVMSSLGTNGDLSIDTLKSNIEKNIKDATYDGSTEFPVTVTYTDTNHYYKVYNNGNVKQLLESTGITSLTADKTIINVGKTAQLTVVLEPEESIGTVTYRSSDTDIATVSNSGLVTGVAEGRVTITATVKEKEKSIDIIVQKLSTASEIFEQTGNTAGKMHIGDYVNYPVTYTNVASLVGSNGTSLLYYPQDSYTGWRVLSIEGTENTKYIKLVSAGVPLNYYHNNNPNKSIENLTTNLFETPINTTPTDYSFYQCGLSTEILNEKTIISKNLFNNSYTQIVNEIPQVQSLTKGEVDNILGKTSTNGTVLSNYDFLAIPSKDGTNTYAGAWLATADPNVSLWCTGRVMMSDFGNEYARGVRLTVSLRLDVTFSLAGGSNATDTTKTWDISN